MNELDLTGNCLQTSSFLLLKRGLFFSKEMHILRKTDLFRISACADSWQELPYRKSAYSNVCK